jgi:hypothetical protein
MRVVLGGSLTDLSSSLAIALGFVGCVDARVAGVTALSGSLQPQPSNDARCWVHKRAYDCILKNASRDLSDLALLKDIFGEGKKDSGNIEKANEVMQKFLEMHPDGKCPPGKSRGKDFKVSSVVHSVAKRSERYTDESASKWDFELFCGQMRSLRGWDVTRCKAEWEDIRADPNTDRDTAGPRHSKERLAIPSFLTGECRSGVRYASSEERRVDTFTKAKRFTDEETDKAFSEIDRGFTARLDVAGFEEKSRLALPASAFLGRGDGPLAPNELLRSVGHQQLSAASVAAGATAGHGAAAGSSAHGSAAVAAGDVPPLDSRSAAAQVIDVRSSRNSMKKTLKGTMDKLRKRVTEARSCCDVFLFVV